MAKRKTQNTADLIDEMALALEVASRCNLEGPLKPNTGTAKAWGNPSPFQEKINELLVKAGRKPVLPPVRPPEEKTAEK